MTHCLLIGAGYSASFVSALLTQHGWTISKTRQHATASNYCLNNESNTIPESCWSQVTHILLSAPPGANGDPVIEQLLPHLTNAPLLQWIGYLSTIGVYGDYQGKWVNETNACITTNTRSLARLKAEQQWLALQANAPHLAVQIFRLGGIYGPGRSVLHQLQAGTATRVHKAGHVFNRIHVEDIARAVWWSMQHPEKGAIYNLVDDEPCPQEEVIDFAATLLGVAPPISLSWEEAKQQLSPMALSFYEECKRVRNTKIKEARGEGWLYPSYVEGLRRCFVVDFVDQ